MAVYNLPPLRKKHQLDATQAGRWIAPPAGLNGLAADLAIEQEELRPDELKSIPDVWAQVQLAVQAFFEPGHEASARVQKQWRGLLALIALQPSYSDDYSLKLDWYELPGQAQPGPTGQGADVAAPGGQPGRFPGTLRALLPTALEPPGREPGSRSKEGVKIGILRFIPAGGDRGVPVAMLSPQMLVAPGRQAGTAGSSLPWMRDGVTDPLDAAELMRPESWDILALYLEQLAGSSSQRSLTQRIELFKDDCRARRSGAATRPERVPGLEARQFPTLDRTWVAEEPPESDCLLRLESRAGTPLEGVILVDPRLEETLGRPPSSIKVWKSRSLADARDARSFERIRKEAAADGFALLRPEDFFTPNLVRLTGDVSIAGHPKALRDALAPISPIALLFGVPPSIEATRSGDACEVSLEVALKKDGTPHRIRKSFDAGNSVERPAPEDLALWPNFSASHWPWNFLRYQHNKNADELRTLLGLSVELVAHDIAAGDGNAERVRRVAEWASSHAAIDARLRAGDFGSIEAAPNKPLFQRVRFMAMPEVEGEHQCLPHGVQAIYLAMPEGRGTVPAGCILPRFEDRQGQNERTIVAIDFGTSNTIAYFDRGRQEPQRVAFQNRVLFPVAKARKTEEIAPTYTDFFPIASYDTPMPTVLKKRDTRGVLSAELDSLYYDVEEIEKKRQMIGFSHLVFFLPRVKKDLSQFLIKWINAGVFRFEIKWENGADAKAIIRFYLRQLMVMIAAELVAEGGNASRIGWRMSFPRAFDRFQKETFEDVTRELADEIHSATGGHGDQAECTLNTEGEAAAAYFMDHRAYNPAVLILDIGGGTTDLAVRYDNLLIWQGSARLAARDFFRNYLADNPDVLKNIDKGAVASLDQGHGDLGNRGTRIRQLVDLLVAQPEFAEAFDLAYSLHCHEGSWPGLRHAAMTALGGVMHYCGLVLRRLCTEGKIPAEQLDSLTVFLGGRGSTFFRRLARGEPPTPLARICSLAAANPDPMNIDSRFSELPKEEVARGLLILGTGRPGAGSASQIQPLGLGVRVKSATVTTTIGPDQLLQTLPPGGRVENLDMAEFRNFLEKLRNAAGLSVNIDSAQARSAIDMKARNSLAVELLAVRTDASGQQDVASLEPPFLTALRGLVGLMASAEAERAVLDIRER